MARKTLYLMNDGGYMESIGIQKTALITLLAKKYYGIHVYHEVKLAKHTIFETD